MALFLASDLNLILLGSLPPNDERGAEKDGEEMATAWVTTHKAGSWVATAHG